MYLDSASIFRFEIFLSPFALHPHAYGKLVVVGEDEEARYSILNFCRNPTVAVAYR